MSLHIKLENLEPMSRDEALAMQGTGWDGDLDELRGGSAPRRALFDVLVNREQRHVHRDHDKADD